ncbi:MAG: dihydrofolate reductase family protein [Balneolales bacterium]
MKTIYYTASSLDGYIADKNNSLDWLFQFGEPEDNYFSDLMANIGALTMGANTFEWMLNHQIQLDAAEAEPWPYTQPAWVFTTREFPGIPGANIQFVKGDVLPVHQRMSEMAGGKNIWIMGGGDLAGQFLDRGLIDEIKISIAPVTLGGGAPVLPRIVSKPPLKLISAKAFGDAFIDLHYAVQR